MLTEAQQEQFTKLWTDTQPVVQRYVASLVPDRWAVRDILQSTSLALLRKFAEYDTQRPFLPWALGVTKYEILSHRRDSARNRIICDTDFLDRYTENWAELAPQMEEEASALQHCVQRLPDRQREIMQLRYVDELTSTDIANRLSLSAANVRTILKRMREGLRRCVELRLGTEGGPT